MNQKLKHILFGSREKSGLLWRLFIYVVLIGIGYIYVYPILFSISSSLMSPEDLVDPTVSWIPTAINFDNFVRAVKVLDYAPSLVTSLLWSVFPALFQTASTAVIGYGLARYSFPLKKMWMALIVMSFLIPTQVTMVPRYVLFKNYGFAGTPLPSLIPALLGQGIKSAVFILIFFQFFSSYPKALDEAAEIDGAGKFKIFRSIAIPMAGPAILVALLFSFIWYWNETNQSSLFFGGKIQTLPMKLSSFVDSYSRFYMSGEGTTKNRINEAIRLAGTLLTVAPLIAVYLALQRQFVEGIERSGITGE